MHSRSLLNRIRAGEIIILKCPWNRPVPGGWAKLIVKVMCSDQEKLLAWGRERGIPEEWLHVSRTGIAHFDLWGHLATKVVMELQRRKAR